MPRGERYKKDNRVDLCQLGFFIGTRIHKAAMGRDVPPFKVRSQELETQSAECRTAPSVILTDASSPFRGAELTKAES